MALYPAAQRGVAFTLQDAASTDEAPGNVLTIPEDIVSHLITVKGSSGVASGVVQVECADDPAYAGTWAPIGNPITVVASTEVILQISGVIRAIRCRISTAIGSGTVTVTYVGSHVGSGVGATGGGGAAGDATAANQVLEIAQLTLITASVSVLDDWDESDRAKVNPIVGQAGVAAGAGAVDALTQRTTLASNDPAVSVLGATTGAAVITDANGTIQQYLRGLVKLLITAGGALVTATLAAGSAIIGKVGIDQTTPGTTNAIAGDVAAAATDSSNPVKIGGKALSSDPTAVATGQRANALFDLVGRLFTRPISNGFAGTCWTGTHIPNTNTQATISQASAGGTKRNVCTGITVTLCSGASAPTAAAPITVIVRDGATGAGTILWQTNVPIPTNAGQVFSWNITDLWLIGSAATAMTTEFSAAGGTNTYESVAHRGIIVDA